MTFYSGIFMRQYLTEIPNYSGTGGLWNSSPDIVVNGGQVLDQTQMVTAPAVGYCASGQSPSGYCTTFPAVLGLNQPNWVYLRAVNTSTSPVSGRLWLLWAPSTNYLWPGTWHADGISVAGQMVNYQPLTLGVAPPWTDKKTPPQDSQPAVTSMPFLVNPSLPSAESIALIALVENQPSTPAQPPLPTPPNGNFATIGALAAWVSGSPNAWLEITPSPNQPALQVATTITAPAGGGRFSLSVSCYGIPTDGLLCLACPGPDAANSANLYMQKVTNPNGNYAVPVTWPAGFTSTATATFWPGPTQPPATASLRIVHTLVT